MLSLQRGITSQVRKVERVYLIQELKDRHQRRIATCRSCGADIIWFATKKGGRMPVDAGTVVASDKVLNLKYHRSHFATCPNANKHRKAK